MVSVVITSFAGNAVALDACLAGLRMCPEFPEANVVVVVGGSSSSEGSDEKKVSDGVTIIPSARNVFDLTGLLVLAFDRPDLCPANAFFYIHDTCVPGPEFLARVAKIVANRVHHTKCLALTRYPSMNMGVYPTDADSLAKFRDVLRPFLDLRGDIAHVKDVVTRNEDVVFLAAGDACDRLDGPMMQSSPCDFYGRGVMRVVERFPDVDLIKIKANWHGTDVWETRL